MDLERWLLVSSAGIQPAAKEAILLIIWKSRPLIVPDKIDTLIH